MKKTLQAAFVQRVERDPDGRALGFYSSNDEVTWYTYRELHDRALGTTAWLASRGLDRGDVCLLVLPSSEAAAILLLGVLLRGAIPLLIAPPTLQGEPSGRMRVLNGIIRRTRARFLVVDQSIEPLKSELRSDPEYTWFLGAGDPAPTADPSAGLTHYPDEADIAAYQLTSGTTGIPRVCVWKQRNVLASLEGMAKAMKTRDGDLCVNWTPLYHDMGLVNNFFFCLTHGVPLVMLGPQDFVKQPALWLRALHRTKATLTWSPNFGFAVTAQRVRDREIEGVRLDNVRAFWNAAERIHFDTIQAFHERFASYGVSYDALKTNFGCAENVGGATFSDPDGPFKVEVVDADALHHQRIAQPVSNPGNTGRVATIVSAGLPCPGMQLEILSPTGKPLPDGHVGEVALGTPSRMIGYLGNARETRRALVGDLLRTGDLGYRRDGELFWVGRTRERLTVRGRKLDPSEFEPILLNVEGLREGCFVAFGTDDARRGTQRVVIVTEVRQPATRDLEEITGEIRERALATLGVTVDEVLLVSPGTLTKTSSGKRRHRHFKELYLSGELQQTAVAH